jgi:Uncharacterized conserved protein
MKNLFFLFLILTSFTIPILDDYEKEIIQFRHDLNADYMNPDKSPLDKALREKFREAGGHPFFEIDKNYRVEAKFKKHVDTITVKIPTSSERMAVFDKYGEATFKMNGKEYTVTIHQSHRSRTLEGYKDLLFFMFTDLTNGEETYGGGRYIDLKIPEGETIIIDFNKAYHPYCAFTYGYSCPVPPKENFMNASINAGIKLLELK